MIGFETAWDGFWVGIIITFVVLWFAALIYSLTRRCKICNGIVDRKEPQIHTWRRGYYHIKCYVGRFTID